MICRMVPQGYGGHQLALPKHQQNSLLHLLSYYQHLVEALVMLVKDLDGVRILAVRPSFAVQNPAAFLEIRTLDS